MRRKSTSEKILIEEVAQAALLLNKTSKNLPIGVLVKIIRTQLGMTQAILAKRSKVPQSTISRFEKGLSHPNLSTLHKIFNALCCNLVIVPMLKESIDVILQKQARKQAEHHIRYLKGTMNLEKQSPDSKFLQELLKEEEARLLIHPQDLWKE